MCRPRAAEVMVALQDAVAAADPDARLSVRTLGRPGHERYALVVHPPTAARGPRADLVILVDDPVERLEVVVRGAVFTLIPPAAALEPWQRGVAALAAAVIGGGVQTLPGRRLWGLGRRGRPRVAVTLPDGTRLVARTTTPAASRESPALVARA